tara:strand:- start:13719 stop:14405 length:687 start_codon:yes stop_codon:yes gene_type:complete
MANNLYKAYISGGESTGRYSSSLRKIDDTYSNIDLTGKKFAIQREETGNILDALSAGVELASTVYGGYQDKKKFESESMPSAQKMIAEKSYDSSKYDDMSYGDFQKTDKFKDYFQSFTPKKVKMNFWESMLKDEPMYTIGDESFKKSDISLMGQLDKSKRLANLTGFDIQDVINVKQDMMSETQTNIINDANTDITTNKIENKLNKKSDNLWDFISGDISYDEYMGTE